MRTDLDKKSVMPVSRPKQTGSTERRARQPAVGLRDLDRVKLTAVSKDRGRTIASGAVGTVVFCYGNTAYEVEFDGIDDFFQVPAENLEKIEE